MFVGGGNVVGGITGYWGVGSQDVMYTACTCCNGLHTLFYTHCSAPPSLVPTHPFPPPLSFLLPQVLLESVEAASAAAGLLLRPLDKKQEKAAFAAHQEGLKTALQGQQDPATVLSLAVTLLTGQVGRV